MSEEAKNRKERRKNGNGKVRKRTRDILPPHPLAVINAAHRIERQQIKQLQKMDAAVELTFDD